MNDLHKHIRENILEEAKIIGGEHYLRVKTWLDLERNYLRQLDLPIKVLQAYADEVQSQPTNAIRWLRTQYEEPIKDWTQLKFPLRYLYESEQGLEVMWLDHEYEKGRTFPGSVLIHSETAKRSVIQSIGLQAGDIHTDNGVIKQGGTKQWTIVIKHTQTN